MSHADLPPLFDAHHHPAFYAALEGAVDLTGCPTAEAALERLAGERDGVTLALGWNDARFHLDARLLDRAGPAFVCNVSLHGFVANAAAKRILAARDAEAMERLEDPAFVERNLPRLFALVVDAGGVGPERLGRFFARLGELGLSGAEEMYLPGLEALAAYRDAGLSARTAIWAAPALLDSLPPGLARQIRGVKLFADGALGTRTAAIARPYRDIGGTGILLYGDDALAETIAAAGSAGRPVALHAIGDRATAQVARVAGRVAAAGRLPPLRIEHAQFISEHDARTLRDLGGILSMQPNFSLDSLQYADRLPQGYAARNNPFRMLIDRVGFRPGIDLLLGSDGMPSGAAPALSAALDPPFPSGSPAPNSSPDIVPPHPHPAAILSCRRVDILSDSASAGRHTNRHDVGRGHPPCPAPPGRAAATGRRSDPRRPKSRESALNRCADGVRGVALRR